MFSITQVRLQPALHNTSDAIMQKLSREYVMINLSNAFEKSRYTAMVLCLLSNDK